MLSGRAQPERIARTVPSSATSPDTYDSQDSKEHSTHGVSGQQHQKLQGSHGRRDVIARIEIVAGAQAPLVCPRPRPLVVAGPSPPAHVGHVLTVSIAGTG